MQDEKCQSNEPESLQDLTCWSLSRLVHPFDAPVLIKSVLDQMKNISGSLRVDLLLFQSDMNILFFADTRSGDISGTDGGRLSLADTKNTVPVAALKGGHTVVVDDVRNSAFSSLSSGSLSLMGVPLTLNDRMHGVLSLEHHEVRAYDDETVRWIQGLSGILSMLLEQSYLTEEIFRLNQKLIDQMTLNASEGDPGYRAHAERVSSVAGSIAEAMGLSDDLVRAVRDSGYLHDVGKSGVTQSILVKPGSLNDDELNEVRRHPVLGRFLLKPLGFQPAVIEGVVSHHERWDGAGYPGGLAGKQIPMTGRILAVAEAFDVMTSDQPYRERMSNDKAIEELVSQKGKQFDPEVVETLSKLLESQR